VTLNTTDRLRARTATLRAVSRALERPADLIGLARNVYGEIARTLDATICFLGLYDAADQTVEVVWQVHQGTELQGGDFPLGDGPTSQAIREGKPRLIRRWSEQGPAVQVQYATDRPGLPESAIVAPVMHAGQPTAVLAVQSYSADAYDADDMALVQSIADQIAPRIAAARHGYALKDGHVQSLPLLADDPADALLVLDKRGQLVALNAAARRLLSNRDGTVVFGYPIDEPQANQWPLGTRELSRQLLPLVSELRQGKAPRHEMTLWIDGDCHRTLGCRASVLMKDGAPAGGVILLRELS
jgi:putative methionine-R-sulfoxide reductase with GAF domain